MAISRSPFLLLIAALPSCGGWRRSKSDQIGSYQLRPPRRCPSLCWHLPSGLFTVAFKEYIGVRYGLVVSDTDELSDLYGLVQPVCRWPSYMLMSSKEEEMWCCVVVEQKHWCGARQCSDECSCSVSKGSRGCFVCSVLWPQGKNTHTHTLINICIYYPYTHSSISSLYHLSLLQHLQHMCQC